ncbi:hypothetical protein NT6N_04950 [Oceaniferula spumae]|uniref:DUF5666 domain-containing protein n=1 Tax=Oceaniferula spumae TaxID=2979115 RepID=A0AAT9FHM0_9BACT
MTDVPDSPIKHISADGKLITSLSGPFEHTTPVMKSGATLTVVIHGSTLVGGKDAETLLSMNTELLDQSQQFALKSIEPGTDGTCRLNYVAL